MKGFDLTVLLAVVGLFVAIIGYNAARVLRQTSRSAALIEGLVWGLGAVGLAFGVVFILF